MKSSIAREFQYLQTANGLHFVIVKQGRVVTVYYTHLDYLELFYPPQKVQALSSPFKILMRVDDP